MSRLTELLRQARKADEQLGKDLEAEIAALTKRRTFGLVFEQHQPEAVELPGRAVRRGDKVRMLPPRGEVKQGDQRLWRVDRIERQAEYDRLEGMSTQPERISLTAPKVAQADRQVREKDRTEKTLPVPPKHLMAAADGTVPIDLNEWERKVLDSESQQPGFQAWYRNPSRATKESLAVAYKDGGGDWKALRPDFVFFGSQHDGQIVVDLVDLVDPHGHHLADAMPKLRGLADFAEKYGHEFRRIESVAETGGVLKVLDLTKHHVRQAVRDGKDAKALYESGIAGDY